MIITAENHYHSLDVWLADKKKILLDSPLKTVGQHVVSVKLFTEVAGKVKVNVVSE